MQYWPKIFIFKRMRDLKLGFKLKITLIVLKQVN